MIKKIVMVNRFCFIYVFISVCFLDFFCCSKFCFCCDGWCCLECCGGLVGDEYCVVCGFVVVVCYWCVIYYYGGIVVDDGGGVMVGIIDFVVDVCY